MQKYASRVTGERLASVAGIGGVLTALAAFGSAMLVAPSARAHINLIDPPPRHVLQGGSDNGIKSCPCGLGGSNRICNVAQDGSDPDRSERVSRFEAGSTITLRFEEFINHAGRFRIAFDPDGADMADFNANILEDVPDPANANGMMWEIPITLPNTTCENCTLQLVQAMEVDQTVEIADPAPISSYYACVDIQLVAPGTLGGDPAEPADDGQPDPDMTGGDTPGDDTGGELTGDDTPGDDTGGDTAGGDMAGGDMAGGEATGANGSGSQNAGNMGGTPLIPAGNGTPTDSSGSTGSSGAADPSGAVAMNGATGTPTGALPGAGMAQPLPNLGDPSTGSSSSGCSLPAAKSSGSALGLGVFGLFALLGLRRERSSRAANALGNRASRG